MSTEVDVERAMVVLAEGLPVRLGRVLLVVYWAVMVSGPLMYFWFPFQPRWSTVVAAVLYGNCARILIGHYRTQRVIRELRLLGLGV